MSSTEQSEVRYCVHVFTYSLLKPVINDSFNTENYRIVH
jgi:hypothetical protein